MATVVPLNWGRIITRGVAAGVCGGILIELFVYFTRLAPEHTSILSFWQYIASSAFGKAAYTSTSYAWIGLGLHAATSIAWGIGYAYLSDVQPAVNARPILSGILFGLVVYVAMQIVLESVGLLVIKNGAQIGYGVLEHTVFFGVPVALVNDWLRPRRA